jgi:glycosyltransferase involved in cell wall biosynthesis
MLLKPALMRKWVLDQLHSPSELWIHGIHTYYRKWVRPPKFIFGWYSSIFLYFQIRQSISQLAEEFLPDVILSSWLLDGVAACKLGEMLNIPTLSIADGSDVNQLPHEYAGWKYACDLFNEKASALIFVSEALRTAGNSSSLHGRKSVVIHNAVDIDLFKPDLPFRNEHVFTILGVGRLIPLKGFHVLLEAFAEVQRRLNGRAHLILVGEGTQHDKLKRQAEDLGIISSVEFAGAVEQKRLVCFYQKADLLCVPSFSEGLPCVVVEAMACGKPVVASNVGGIPEIVDSRSGICVEPGNPMLLCEALLQAKNQAWDGEMIRQRIVDSFEWGKWTQTVIQLITATSLNYP